MLHPTLIFTRKGTRVTALRQIAIRVGLLFVLCWLASATVYGQTTYTWQGANNASWTTAANWTPTRTTPAATDILQFNTGTTLTITSVPTQTIGRFVMSNNTSITLTAAAAATLTIGNGTGTDLDIPSGSSLTVSTNLNVTLASSATASIAGTLTINTSRTYDTNGTSVVTTVTGTITNSGTITNATASKLLFQSGSTYTHNQNGGTIPTATWNANSTCNITGITSSDPNGDEQAFGNVTWNCASQSSTRNFTPTSIAGDFLISNTNNNQLRVQTGALTIGGDFTQSGTSSTRIGSNTARTWTVAGNVSITGGTLDMDDGNDVGTINVAGDFSITGGTLTESGTGSGAIVFNKSGTQTYTSGGTVSNTINFTVNSGSTLQMAAAGTAVSGGGTFTLSSGATLGIRSAAGITTSGATGNIQVTGTRTYSTSADYIYNGTAAQVTGNGLPATVSDLTIDNSAGVSLTGGVTVSGTLGLTSGALSIGANTLTINGAINTTSGSLTGGGSSNISVGTLAAASTTLPAVTLNNLTLNRTAGLLLGGDVTVGGTLTLTAGDLTTGANTLTHTLSGAAACAGPGDVVGAVKRTTIVTGTTYCFGNTLNTINFASATLSSPTLTVTLVKGSLPGNISNAVKRLYTITPTGISGFSATVQLRYLDSELTGTGLTESALKLWRDSSNGGGTWVNMGGTVNTTTNIVNTTGVTAFSPWVFASGTTAPTAVRMIGVEALAYNDGVRLVWRTGHEVDNLGFRIYREENGQRTRVTPGVVAGSALMVGERSVLTAGWSYTWLDVDGSANAAYWLEDLDLDGSRTWHGPFTAIVRSGASEEPEGLRRPDRNARSARNSVLLERLGRERANEAEATRDLTPVGAAPNSLLSPGGVPARSLGRADVQGALAPARPRQLGGEEAIKLSVKQEGWYRVTQPQLVAAGLSPRVDPRGLRLYVDGLETTIYVSGAEDGRFDATDAVEFYGLGLDTPATDTRVYWLLSERSGGARVRKAPLANSSPMGESFTHTVERRDRMVYVANLLNGAEENFFGAVVTPGEALDQTLRAPSVDSAAIASATLEVALQGLTKVPHSVSVSFNGAPLGFINFDGRARGTQSFTVPQSQVLEGVNKVTLQSAAGPSDYNLVAHLRLTYTRLFRADNDTLAAPVPAYRQVTIGGFTSGGIRVFDVTDERNVAELETSIKQEGNGFSVTATPQGLGARRLLAINPARALGPAGVKANKPSRWLTKSNRADLLVITHNTLAAEFEPLAAHRRKQGWRVEVVDIEDVYDEVSAGNKTATGLGEFLAYAARSWMDEPRYVLLAGDASYDPRNYTNNGESDLAPTRLVDAGMAETASDDALVDFNGDGLPDLSVGRLPARTAAEARRMVERLINYDKAPASNEVALVADRNDGHNFESLIESLLQQVPMGQKATAIFRGRLDDATARAQTLGALNRGPRVVNYFGHGSFNLWRGDLLTAADALALQNGNRSSVYVMMTCLTGYFLEPAADGLAEALLKSPNGGAVAVWAGSGYTEAAPQQVMDQSVFGSLFRPGQLLGDAVRQAKAATTDTDTRLTWILFGDPTMRLR